MGLIEHFINQLWLNLVKKAEPENLTHADTVTIKDFDDAFTLVQVDNLVAELDN